MIVELVSNTNGKTYRMAPRAFGKLLHMARFNGWWPEKSLQEWPSESWDTEIILPHVGAYMPGHVSKSDAYGLMRALTRAMATGEIATDGSVQLASLVLQQIARDGSFEVRFDGGAGVKEEALIGAAVT
jgi:hypothetical protein